MHTLDLLCSNNFSKWIKFEYSGNICTCLGFYPSTLLQPVNSSKNAILIEFWNSISSFLCKYFFACLSGKILDRFFIFLSHCFYSCKPQIHTKETGLIIQFVITQKNLFSYVKKNEKQTWWWCRCCLFCFYVYYS